MNSTDHEAAYTQGVTAEILEAPSFEANVFSAWADGFTAGQLDLPAIAHRAYERGRRDAFHAGAFQRRLTLIVVGNACLIAGIVVGVLVAGA